MAKLFGAQRLVLQAILEVLAQATVERLPPLPLSDADAHGEERWPVSPENGPVISLG